MSTTKQTVCQTVSSGLLLKFAVITY